MGSRSVHIWLQYIVPFLMQSKCGAHMGDTYSKIGLKKCQDFLAVGLVKMCWAVVNVSLIKA